MPGDFDLLIDDDGTGWHVQTTTNDPNATKGFVVTRLNDDFTGPAVPRQAAVFKAPMPAEGPAFFKRGLLTLVLRGIFIIDKFLQIVYLFVGFQHTFHLQVGPTTSSVEPHVVLAVVAPASTSSGRLTHWGPGSTLATLGGPSSPTIPTLRPTM